MVKFYFIKFYVNTKLNHLICNFQKIKIKNIHTYTYTNIIRGISLNTKVKIKICWLMLIYYMQFALKFPLNRKQK